LTTLKTSLEREKMYREGRKKEAEVGRRRRREVKSIRKRKRKERDAIQV